MKKYIKNKMLAELSEWILAILCMAALFVAARNFIFRTAFISGPSMEPTLYHAERVIILKLPYIFGSPKINDVVAFPYKENPSQLFVKRVVGLPGDVVDIIDRRMVINGEELNDAFAEGLLISVGDTVFPITVPDNACFVLGDHRNSSNDSRFTGVGCINKKEMLGKIVLRFWPLSRFGRVR